MVESALLMGFRFPAIMTQLREFDFHCTEDDLSPILDAMKQAMPGRTMKSFEACERFDLVSDRFWYDMYGAYEFADFYLNRKIKKEEYFKWMADCYWILHNREVATLVHIFMFNADDDDSISGFIMTKFKKKVGVDALALYRKLFWDCAHLDAKSACYYYTKFRDDAIIVRNRANGLSEVGMVLSQEDGSDVPLVFNDSNYIRWKMGDKNVEVPSANEFVKRVMRDAYYKYEEAMAMTQSIEEMSESGTNQFGPVSLDRTVRRNVEEHRIKAAKAWMDIYFKASSHIKTKGSDEEDFFKRMSEISIKFDEEKILPITEAPQMLEDIKGDM